MDEKWVRAIKASMEGTPDDYPKDNEEVARYAALNLFMGDAAHHEQYWKERLIEALGITREELCRALYGWNEGNWPDKGVAP